MTSTMTAESAKGEPEAGGKPATPVKRAYPAPAATPTQSGPRGIRFDFNDGCRLVLPEGSWHARLSDLDTGNILYETDIGAGHINSTKRYYLRCRFECTRLITAEAVKAAIQRIPAFNQRSSQTTPLPQSRIALVKHA